MLALAEEGIEVLALGLQEAGGQDAPSHWHDKEWLQRLGERDRVRRQRLEELRAAGALQQLIVYAEVPPNIKERATEQQ